MPRLVGDQPAPDGIAFGPEIFPFIIKAPGVAVDDHPQRHAVHARADPAIVERRPGVNGDAVGLRRIADDVSPGVNHKLEQHALIETSAANEKIIGLPFTALVLSPCFTQPLAVRFKSAGGEDAGFGDDPLFARQRGDEFAVI